MSVSFSGFRWWFRGVGNKDKQLVSNGSCLNSSSSDTVKFQTKIAPSKGEWTGGEKTRVVQSDCLILSGYESDGPEWSIGWEEPHGPGFQDDGGFAVLVPCYKHGCKQLVEGPNNQLLRAIKNLSNGFSSEGSNTMQQRLPTLQNF